MVSYDSTCCGDQNMSICRQTQKTYSRDDSAKSSHPCAILTSPPDSPAHSAQKKKLGGNNYEKNLAMQDTTNLEPGGGVWEVLACN